MILDAYLTLHFSCCLHSEVSVDIAGQVLSVKQEVVAHYVERQTGAPMGGGVI